MAYLQKHFIAPGQNSNPSLSAENIGLEAIKSHFLRISKNCATESMPSKNYNLAQLVHHNYDLSKRWYVKFWAWDVTKEKKVRRRLFEPINRKKNVLERLHIAKDMIRQINYELQSGKVLGKQKRSALDINTNVTKMTLLKSIDFVKEQKQLSNHRKNYYKMFQQLKVKVQKWLDSEQRNDFLLRDLDHDDVLSFFDFLQSENVANKTFNNYRGSFSVAINFLMKRNPNLFKVNPIVVIDSLPVIAKKHAAYSDAQMKKIHGESLKLGFNQLLLQVQFIYYTLARPTELCALKVGDIELENNRILFRGAISKNKRDEYVGIPAQLKKIIIENKIVDYPAHYFIFGFHGPAEKAASYLYFYGRNKKVLSNLGFDKLPLKHSLYSYKHSGAISLYKATKDIKLLQRQCRHTSLDQTNEYLRDLSLHVDYEGLKDWQGAI
jgi:integrase